MKPPEKHADYSLPEEPRLKTLNLDMTLREFIEQLALYTDGRGTLLKKRNTHYNVGMTSHWAVIHHIKRMLDKEANHG